MIKVVGMVFNRIFDYLKQLKTTKTNDMESLRQQQENFENKVGMTLISEHTFEESSKTTWVLRLRKFDGGKRCWVMWCEHNGKDIHQTLDTGKNLSSDLKEMFNID